MSDLTLEELDEARADEAWRLFVEQPGDDPHSRVIAARLAREGWTPPPKVDPDLLAAREIAIKFISANERVSAEYRAGMFDRFSSVGMALAGIKHGRATDA